jgi:hypothetical protein
LLVPPGGESQALACFPSVLAQSSAAQFALQGYAPPDPQREERHRESMQQ